MRAKITVVGAGNVGATVAQRLAERNYADIVLIDIAEGLAEGRALDLLEAGPITGSDSAIHGGADYGASDGSDVVIMTGGVPRRPGMSRDDLVTTNAGVVSAVAREVGARSPDCVLLMVTNPLDAMAHVAQVVSGLPRERVIGMAGVLDTARFRAFLALELDASVADIHAHVLGGHGDTMVPLTRLATCAGVPIAELIPPRRVDAIVQRVRDGGAEIVNLVKTGSAFYAPSAAVAQMVDAILLDTRQVLPCSVRLEGEYGVDGVFTGVPCRLGTGGLLEVIGIELLPEEREALARSVAAVRELIALIEDRLPDLAQAPPRKHSPAPGPGS
jgi:malate dehydrogenase